MKKVHIHRQGTAYLGREIIMEGFVGECDGYDAGAKAFIINTPRSFA